MTDQTNDPMNDPLRLAREAYVGSTSYFNSSIRTGIEQDIRQFQGLHPRGSKYLSEANRSRSRLFRPKTRTTIRKNEAVAAEAFFSTIDVVSVTAEDDNDEQQQASAAIMQELLQYRLTKSIPWFLTCIGGYQDALTVGTVVSYQCWQYDSKKKIDRPMIKLLPLENVRFDPAADWTDPVNTSPYWIELIPMYVKDVKARMSKVDEKTGEPKWIKCDDAKIMTAAKAYGDTTRLQREQGRTDSKDQQQTITNFSIVWVHKNIIEIDGEDMVYYTLGTEHLLSKPVPLADRYAHGKRPYVVGGAIIETHKTYWSGLPRISRDVQGEINDLANLRIDNVRFALSKRYFVKRNKQVDIRSLMRNVAGAATLMDDPEGDVKVVDFADVTGSSYQEQDRLNLDFDDITGSFSGSSVQSNRKLNETVGGMELLDGSANQVTGYQLRTFVETWVEPVLRQLILLEQYYETDDKILALAGDRAKLFQKFNIDAVTDDLLMNELTLNVNVGMGATNPQEQVKKFMQAMTSLRDLLADGILEQRGLKLAEVTKELFGKLGYRDGQRFFDHEGSEDPQVTQLKLQIQELSAKLAQKEDPALTQARIDEINAKIKALGTKDKNMDADTVAKLVAAMFSAMQAGEVVAAVPGVAPVADKMLESAGFSGAEVIPGDPTGLTVNAVKSPATGMEFTPPTAAGAVPAEMQGPTEGMQQGIETQQADSVGFDDGGLVDEEEIEDYANGGAVGPLVDIYGQEIMKDQTTGGLVYPGGVQIPSSNLSFEQNQYESQRLAQQNQRLWGTPMTRRGDPISPMSGGILSRFADGGPIVGPGTGTSDTIPAVVDGSKPAAVSAGEYHLPAAVVAKVGLPFLQDLIAKYHTPVEGAPAPDPTLSPMALESGDFIIPADVVAALGKDFFDRLIAEAGA